GGGFRRLGKPTCISGFDLIAKRRSLAEADGWISARGCQTASRQGLKRGVGEPRAAQVIKYDLFVVIPVRHPCQEERRIFREHPSQSCHNEICELILFNAIPDIKDEWTAWLQDSARFTIGYLFVGKEHHAKLAKHDIERAIRVR